MIKVFKLMNGLEKIDRALLFTFLLMQEQGTFSKAENTRKTDKRKYF